LLDSITNEIERLDTRREALQKKLESKQDAFESFKQDRSGGGPRGVIQEFQDALREQERVQNELRAIQQKRGTRVGQLRESKGRAGVKSADEALARIDEIDSRIETQTLTNADLKSLLAEKDRLRSIFKSLAGMTAIETDVATLRAQEEEKRNELDAVRERVQKAKEARNAIQGAENEHQAAYQKFRAELDEIRGQISKVKDEIRQKVNARKEAQEKWKADIDEYRAKHQQTADLAYEKNVIYSEADRQKVQIDEGRRRIGEVKDAVNPNEPKINAAVALLAYLEDLSERATQKPETPAAQPKGGSEADRALLAALRKPSKKQIVRKPSTPAKAGTLSHDVAAHSQFAVVEVDAPLTLEQIPGTIEVLTAKIKEWRDAFRAARLALNVLPDGKVTVAITVA
jgi:chromosome segregation ATPase